MYRDQSDVSGGISAIEVADQLKREMTLWADTVIEDFKTAMRCGETYLRWGDKLMYTIGGDVWVDEAWWIETAKCLFEIKKPKNNSLNGLSELEILIFHNLNKFKKIALDKINYWYREEELHDSEYWWRLIGLVDPGHPFILEILEEPETIKDLVFLANLGYPKGKENCRNIIMDDSSKPEWYRVWDLCRDLRAEVIFEILPESLMRKIHSQANLIALKSPEQDYDVFSILYPAIKLNWEDTIELLSQNPIYLNFLGRELWHHALCERAVLEWSLTSRRQLAQKFAILSKHIVDSISRCGRWGEMSLPVHNAFADATREKTTDEAMIDLDKLAQIAIAWKRSLLPSIS